MTRFMGPTGLSGKERCAARCALSDKHHDAPGGPVWPTEGRGTRWSESLSPHLGM